MILWEPRPDGLWIFLDGKHIGTVKHRELPMLILKAAKVLSG